MRISDWSSDVCSSDLGTLFGRNTTGGAVLFVPRKPDNAFSGHVVGRLGSYDRHDLEFALGGALIPDQLMIRVSGQILRRDGFTKNLFDNSRTDNERKTRSEEHPSELQSLMRNSYAVFCLKNKKHK